MFEFPEHSKKLCSHVKADCVAPVSVIPVPLRDQEHGDWSVHRSQASTAYTERKQPDNGILFQARQKVVLYCTHMPWHQVSTFIDTDVHTHIHTKKREERKGNKAIFLLTTDVNTETGFLNKSC